MDIFISEKRTGKLHETLKSYRQWTLIAMLISQKMGYLSYGQIFGSQVLETLENYFS